jgi:hypothetical protein
MRRAASLFLLLVACSSKKSASDRCAEVMQHPEQLDEPYKVLRFAKACADKVPEGPCRRVLQRIDDLDPMDLQQVVRSECLGESAPADAAPAPSGPARLLLHQAGAELVWHGLDLQLGKDCPTLGVAVDTAGLHGQLVLVVDRDVLYPDAVATLDCLRTHVSDVSLEEAP